MFLGTSLCCVMLRGRGSADTATVPPIFSFPNIAYRATLEWLARSASLYSISTVSCRCTDVPNGVQTLSVAKYCSLLVGYQGSSSAATQRAYVLARTFVIGHITSVAIVERDANIKSRWLPSQCIGDYA
jgi:hypothetical protein